jgi:predicted ATP-dependent endonuclease of OLD family
MADLTLDSLEITNFRAFRHLKIEKLGRVNLIVGKNSVGKTTLLEALDLFANRGVPALICKILEGRDENVRPPTFSFSAANNKIQFAVIKQLFHGKPKLNDTESAIITVRNTQKQSLEIAVTWYNVKEGSNGNKKLVRLQVYDRVITSNQSPFLELRLNNDLILQSQLDIAGTEEISFLRTPRIPSLFVPATNSARSEFEWTWDSIVLTPQEEQLLAILKVINPKIEKVNVIANPLNPSRRIPMVKLAEIEEPVPLRSLGEGVYRIFIISLALVSTKNGLLLLDEFENGLHYSIQYDLWKLIFQVARQLNVQVFATTHSWDCIEAFTKAAIEDKQDEGMLIRLTNNEGDIVATVFDENELGIATREQIEVR